MPSFATSTKWGLRKLLGASLVSDIDAGFDALGEDVDAKLTPWSAGTWAALPAAPRANQRYFVTDWGMEVVYDGANWQLVSNVGIGDYVQTQRSSDPPGGYFMLCNGRSIVRADYPAYSAIVGGTSTNITLPDLRGRSTVAPSNMGGPNATGNDRVQLGAGGSGGEVSHTLTDLESGVNRNGVAAAPYPGSGFVLDVGAGPIAFLQLAGSGYGIQTPSTVPLQQRNADAAHNNVHPVVAVNVMIRVK